ncbi:nucleoporin Nup43 [Pseudomyrmex gracilis]|uniref:nucleoporin Nup43 n=1 Tax=Pseudomyrmex gracilis TaxID=219809 RepID=UPI000995427E|nr:nucleoporin Nup43 [Pseudomyrmex gracilis]
MAENVQGTFVSEKISKIRWQYDDFAEAKNFLTGSWDNPVNKITYWTFKTNYDEELSPDILSSHSFLGDVTELKFVSRDFFVASSSLGSVRLLQVDEDTCSEFKEHMAWEFIHSFKTTDYASCTALSTFEQDIASVGEDGRLNLLTAAEKKPVRVIENADSCSIYCVDFLKHNEVLTGNSRGHMKIWDLRNNRDVPDSTFMLSDQVKTAATSITHHPTQRHIVVAGGGDGSLTAWDLRENTYPIVQLNAHAKAVSEIFFHQDRPDNIFTCSVSGELWHWNNAPSSKLKLNSVSDAHWLKQTVSTNAKVTATSLCPVMHKPINSIDINRSLLLFGCDNEAMYIVKNVPI